MPRTVALRQRRLFRTAEHALEAIHTMESGSDVREKVVGHGSLAVYLRTISSRSLPLAILANESIRSDSAK